LSIPFDSLFSFLIYWVQNLAGVPHIHGSPILVSSDTTFSGDPVADMLLLWFFVAHVYYLLRGVRTPLCIIMDWSSVDWRPARKCILYSFLISRVPGKVTSHHVIRLHNIMISILYSFKFSRPWIGAIKFQTLMRVSSPLFSLRELFSWHNAHDSHDISKIPSIEKRLGFSQFHG